MGTPSWSEHCGPHVVVVVPTQFRCIVNPGSWTQTDVTSGQPPAGHQQFALISDQT